MIRFQCPHCRSALQVDDELAGHSIKCSHCQQKARVPGGGSPGAKRVVCVCAGCKTTFAAASQQDAHTARCPKCGASMEVPGAEEVAVDGGTVRFRCDKCGQAYCVLAKYAGKKFGCLACKAPCHIPKPPEPEPAAQDLDVLAASSPPGWEDALAADLEAAQQRKQQQEEEEPAGFDVSAIQMPARAKPRGSIDTSTDWRDRLEALPFTVRIPMGIVAGLTLSLLCGGIWTAIAAGTGRIFYWLCVPTAAAAAAGLVPFMRDRNIATGLFAAFLGFVGIIAGKAMITKWAVLPLMREEINKQIVSPEALAVSEEDMKEMIDDPEAMFVPVCLQLAEEGNWDCPFLERVMMTHAGDQTLGDAPFEDEAQISQAIDEVCEAVDTWPPEKLEDAARQSPERMRQFASELMDSAPVRAFTAGFAFVLTFSLWDLLMIPIALGAAFKIGAGS